MRDFVMFIGTIMFILFSIFAIYKNGQRREARDDIKGRYLQERIIIENEYLKFRMEEGCE